MKFTHNSVTSITVQKVENITTSMTRAGLGDDTYRRQREKQRYLKCKQEQAEKQQKMREQFFNKRNEKIRQAQSITQKRHAKRQKKKERQKQLKKKMKFIQKIDKDRQVNREEGADSDEDEDSQSQQQSQQVNQIVQQENKEQQILQNNQAEA